MNEVKESKQLERRLKGVANHWRVRILKMIEKEPGVTLEGLWSSLGGNEKTISEHTRKLVHAGLIDKKYEGTSVHHVLSQHGKLLCDVFRKLQ